MRIVRNQWVWVLVLIVGSWLFAGLATAEDCSGSGADGTAFEGRLFEGEVKANKKKAKVVVNLKPKKKERMRQITIRQGGEPIPFAFHPQAIVSGLKKDVNKIKSGDWVRICGPRSAMATPRWAFSIEVFEKEDAAKDVD
ncbi:MAG: hypothetical protein GY723_02130 [bacterium]|nr:hypothetical protein [bacterium]